MSSERTEPALLPFVAAQPLTDHQLYYLGTLLFRQGLSRFLRARVDGDDLCREDAERITNLIGAENARSAYALSLLGAG